MLDLAKKYLRRILSTLAPQIEAGVPVVVLEPSCASVFRDELHNLFPQDRLARKLREQTFLLSEFLETQAQQHALPQLKRKALVQGHCHHKSVLKFDSESAVLRRLGLDSKTLASGCCGMAGSFGFEQDKYGVSIAIGEHALLPSVRSAPISTLILADGFSCREQIGQQTNRQALHLAEVIQMGLHQHQHTGGTAEMYPEAKLFGKRIAARRRSRHRALATLAGIAGGIVLLVKLARR